MKLKAITLLMVVSLAAMASAYENRCHKLVESKFDDIINWQLGDYIKQEDGLQLLPLKNDFCGTKACLGHRVCYTQFAQFEDHAETMTRLVGENTDVLKNYIKTLAGQFAEVNNIEQQLTALRSNVRQSQITQKDLDIAKAEAQNKLNKDQAHLQVLASHISERKKQWQKRIEGLTTRIADQDGKITHLQVKADVIFQGIVKDAQKFKKDYPNCFQQIQPYMMSIFQLYQYQDSLEKNRKTVESFSKLREEFANSYMTILIKTFGQGVASKIDLNNLHGFVANSVQIEGDKVKQVHAMFARQFGQQAQSRRLRFAQSTKSWKFFVTGFATNVSTEINMYSDISTKFYMWSAQLDHWIKEIYALQLSLEMMTSEWQIKIATRISELEALRSTESEVTGTISQLNTDLSEIAASQEKITAQIKASQATVTKQDREFQSQVNTLELQLNAFSKKVSQTCSSSGELGSLFVEKISSLQANIEQISQAVKIEYSVLVELQNFMTSADVANWKAKVQEFEKLWADYFKAIQTFHIKAQEMWQSGAYDRNALNSLADEVESQKSQLLTAWRHEDSPHQRMFYKLGQLNGELLAAATNDQTNAPKVRELVQQNANSFKQKRRR